ncbi:MAG TPA: hypothetical protein VNZ54_04730 [bacterium]|jgi:hypothetical protein|nr:hypothetical protein [bacterium]HXC63521.1 hypothetical protein [bacterium]
MNIKRLAALLLAAAAACTPALARADYEQLDSFYFNAGVAGIQLQNNDLNTYYGSNSFSPSVTETFDFAFGWQFRQPFAIEFGASVGPFRSVSGTYGMTNLNGPQTDTITDARDENSYTFYVMPALRLISPGLGRLPILHTFGLKLGGASLYGTETFTDQTTGDVRTQTNSATGDYFAVVYRAEQMLGRSLSIGVELGYASNVFNEVDYSDGSFSAGNNDPAGINNEPLDFGWTGVNTNANGSNEQVDFSGPFVKVMLGGWFLPSFRRMDPGQFDTSDPDTQVVPRRPRAMQPAPEASQAPLDGGSFASPDGSRLVKILSGGDAFLYDTATPPGFTPVFLAHQVTRVRFSNTDQGQPLQIQLNLSDGSTLHFDSTGQPIRFR